MVGISVAWQLLTEVAPYPSDLPDDYTLSQWPPGAFHPMRAFAHLVDFFFDIVAGLGAGRFSFALVLGSSAACLGLWHGMSQAMDAARCNKRCVNAWWARRSAGLEAWLPLQAATLAFPSPIGRRWRAAWDEGMCALERAGRARHASRTKRRKRLQSSPIPAAVPSPQPLFPQGDGLNHLRDRRSKNPWHFIWNLAREKSNRANPLGQLFTRCRVHKYPPTARRSTHHCHAQQTPQSTRPRCRPNQRSLIQAHHRDAPTTSPTARR